MRLNALAVFPLVAAPALAQGPGQKWEEKFDVDKASLGSTGSNPYFALVPGTKYEYEGGGTRLVVTVLEKTKLVDGVEVRIVEEREWSGKALVEVSLNYFAADRRTGDVYYFGEDVENYRNGRVANHEGSWQAGKGGAKFGLMMPGKPTVGRAFYQEIAKGTAMDRAKIADMSATVKTPSGTYRECLKSEETTPLEPGVTEYKFYAPGVGLVVDSGVKLVKKSSAALKAD